MCMNKGICVNDNLCNCEKTKFTGIDCTQRYKLRRNIILNTSLQVSCILFILITTATAINLFLKRNHEIVKAGKR